VDFNTAIGGAALQANTTGTGNTAIGYRALNANTTGANNIAIGLSSLLANTVQSNNVAIGTSALAANLSGTQNIAIGTSALSANLSGSQNVAIGANSLAANTLAGSLTAIGFNALAANTTGTNNTALGANALLSNTTGFNHTAIGYRALAAVTTGGSGTALGFNAGSNYTGSESNNISIGAGVTGTAGESSVLRIGATATMIRSFIGGIYGTISTAGTVSAPVVIDPFGQLGTVGPLNNGQLLIGSTGLNPVVASLTGGTNITVTNGAGTITLAANILTYGTTTATSYMVQSTDYYISVDSTQNGVSVLLPNAPTTYRSFVIKDRTGASQINAVTVTTVGGTVTIDGQTAISNFSPYFALSVLFNGTGYEIF
jgi:hypothetical protein